MNIYTPVGAKVQYAFPKAGYDGDIRQAAENLMPLGIYTVSRTEVGSWRTDVEFRELPGIWFNSVQFRNVEDA